MPQSETNSGCKPTAINLIINLKLTILDKNFEKIYEIAEGEGWEVSHTVCQGEISFEFSKLSPAGQDFCFTRDVDYDDDEDNVFAELRDAVYS